MRRCLTLVAARAQPARRTSARLCTAGAATTDASSLATAAKHERPYLRARSWKPRVDAWRKDPELAAKITEVTAIDCADDLLQTPESYVTGLKMFQLLYAERLLNTSTYRQLLGAALHRNRDTRYLSGRTLIRELAKIQPTRREPKKAFYFLRGLTKSTLLSQRSVYERKEYLGQFRSILKLTDEDIQYVELAASIDAGSYDDFVEAYEKLEVTTPQLISLLVRACLMQAVADTKNVEAYLDIATEAIVGLAMHDYMFGADYRELQKLVEYRKKQNAQN